MLKNRTMGWIESRLQHILQMLPVSVPGYAIWAILCSAIKDMLRDMDIWSLFTLMTSWYISPPKRTICPILRVLSKLQLKPKYTLKGDKCEFHVTTIAFLGYIICQEGILMDNPKVNVLNEWPSPYTNKELQRLLSFANYRSFLRGFCSQSTSAPPHSAPEEESLENHLEWSGWGSP